MSEVVEKDQNQESTPQFVDYKDVQYLRKFVNAHARIQGKKRTHAGAARQREVTNAIKRARYMALMPYIAR